MKNDLKICMAGEGAFGNKHLDAIERIEGVDVAILSGGVEADTRQVAERRGIKNWTLDLDDALADDGIDAVILATPTQMHADQASRCMRAGKHVLVEIPMADTLADSEALVALQKETGVVAMVDHVRRFNPPHEFINRRIKKKELELQQMNAHTYFFRRKNINAKGEPRSWTDHLLWHHACHTVDLFQYQTGEVAEHVQAVQGPIHPELGIAMDMSIGLKTPSGAICTLSLSFNNDGPLGTVFRYICDNGTYLTNYDDLFDGNNEPIDLTGVTVCNDGIELCDREFFAAIREEREPNSSLAQALSTMQTLDRIEKVMQ